MGRIPARLPLWPVDSCRVSPSSMGKQHRSRQEIWPHPRPPHTRFSARGLCAGVEGGALLELRRTASPLGRGRRTQYQHPRLMRMNSQPQKHSLRRDDSAQRVTARQHDPAMIHHRRRGQRLKIVAGESGTFDQRPAAGRTPVSDRLFCKHRVALAANPFHPSKIQDAASNR